MKQQVIDFLMGKQPQTAEVNPSFSYGSDVDNFINSLKQQPYMQKLYNAPIQERLSDEQIAEKVANGLNLGIPELAQAQKDVGIRIPQGAEQVAQAQVGEFNKPMVGAGVNNAPRQGGLIQGYKQGYNLNYDNPTNTVGTRIGQGLGTLGRFADSPLGRGLIAYGLSNAMGDTNPLEQAFTAGVGRQNNMTQDRVYRNQLKQLGMTDDEVNAIPGNVTKDVFEGVTSGMRLGNQRMTYGQLAMLDDGIAEEVRKNPALANMFVPINIARDIYGLKRETAQGKMAETKAKTEETKAKTEKTKAETKQVGKPKITINRKEGTTTSNVNIVHSSGSGKGSNTPTRPTQNNYVKMQAPNGKIYNVPRSRMREYINAGGKVVG